jgi:hypothetical protein
MGFIGEICITVLLQCSTPQTTVVDLVLPSSLLTHLVGVVSRKIKFGALLLLGLFCWIQFAWRYLHVRLERVILPALFFERGLWYENLSVLAVGS